MLRPLRPIFAALLLFAPTAVFSQMDGHGPDAWQVVGVAPDDALNMRSGPGTDYLVIGTLPPHATGLGMVTCVPYLSMAQFQSLSATQRANLPPRWCLVRSRDGASSGWVAARFLAEDTTTGAPQTDPLVTEAVTLVQRLYEQHQQARAGHAPEPFDPTQARQFFFSDVAERLARGTGADPLYGAQDFDIAGLDVSPAPEREIFRGMITIHARFENFGEPQLAIFRLRVDPALDPPEVRIMRIEHEGWSVP